MKNMDQTWEDIRTRWVQGRNRKAEEQLLKHNKKEMLEIVRVALVDYYHTVPEGTATNGALIDLLEVLRFAVYATPNFKES